MRLSTSTCLYFNRPDGTKTDLCKSVEGLHEAGYRVLDMNFHDASVFKTEFVTDGWKDFVLRIREKAESLSVCFSQSHAHFFNYCEDGPDNDYLMMLVGRSFAASGMLNVPWVTIHAATDFSADCPYKSSRKKGIEFFRRLSDLAYENNTGIAIENLWELNISPQRRYTANVEELIDLVDAVDRDNVGVCWDVEHSLIMKQDTRQIARIIEPYLKSTHISDYVHTFHDHILPYEGIADWDGVIDAFASMKSYKGDFTYEVHRFTMRLPDWAVPAALKYSYELGTNLLKEIEERRKKL